MRQAGTDKDVNRILVEICFHVSTRIHTVITHCTDTCLVSCVLPSCDGCVCVSENVKSFAKLVMRSLLAVIRSPSLFEFYVEAVQLHCAGFILRVFCKENKHVLLALGHIHLVLLVLTWWPLIFSAVTCDSYCRTDISAVMQILGQPAFRLHISISFGKIFSDFHICKIPVCFLV